MEAGTLTKAQLTNQLHEIAGIPESLARKMVESFFETIHEVLESGHHLKISGFGNFILRDKKERPGRNPKTGKATRILARRVVTFRQGVKLKSQVAKSLEEK